MKTYESALSRLRRLPDIFRGTDINMLFHWSSPISASYIAQWTRSGLIRPLGGRSGVYFNLVTNRHPDLARGLRYAYPMAIRIGADVIREAGWTTQITTCPDIAIPAGAPSYEIADFALQSRSNAWFERVAPGVISEGDNTRCLRPEWALADMIARAKDGRVRDAWMLAPDDIDLDEARAAPQMQEALEAFALSMSELDLDTYETTYDLLLKRRFDSSDKSTEEEKISRPAYGG